MRPPTDPSVSFGVITDPSTLLAARQLHGQVYVDSGYVRSLSEWGVIDDRYVDRSTYFGAVTQTGDVAGVVRQINPTIGLDLPAALHVPLSPEGRRHIETLDPRRVVEVSALAVDKAHWTQAFTISAGLYRAMYTEFLTKRSISHWIAIMDDRLLTVMQDMFGFPFRILGSSTWYMGSACTPVALDAYEAFDAVYNTDPELRDYFLEGLDLSTWHDLAAIAA